MKHQDILLPDSEMRRRIGAFDWAPTSLGPQASWSPTLLTLVDLILSSRHPMFLAWGGQRTWLYNDAFIAIAEDRHPFSLGRSVKDVWPEAGSTLRPLYDRVFAGEPISMTGFQLGLDRKGVVENAMFDFSYTPVRTHVGDTVLGLFGVCMETTAPAALRRQQLVTAQRERTRILEMSLDLFAVASFEGRLLSINPAWAGQLEYTEAALLERPFAEIIHPDDLPETARVLAALMSGRSVHQFHVRLLKADGSSISYAWSAVPELDPSNGTFYTVGRDISEERKAMQELQEAQEALRQAQKMEAVGQLTGGLAHDFNNLLAGVGASLQILQKRLNAGEFEGAQRYIELGMDSARRAATLTQRLLAFSRRQTLDPKPTNVNHLTHGIEELIRQTLGPTVHLEVSDAGDLWKSMVDASQLENSLLNLCINARDAMPEGGRLTIETSNNPLNEREARQLELAEGDYICMCVRDTGHGMDAQTKAQAFDPFFTTKPVGQGTGLGLSMVYGFVQQSGGKVRIESEKGHGTTVCIYLPRYLGEAADDRQVNPPELIAKDRRATVLVVEDEMTIRSLMVEVLEEEGYQVLGAEDGASGLKLLDASGRVDMLVTDVGLPGGMNGRQVADAARLMRPDLPVLFITGYVAQAAVGNGMLAPGMDVMTKPFEFSALIHKIRGMINT